MARHLSKSQADKLGRRLRHSTEASELDRQELRLLVSDYAEPLRLVQDRVRLRLGLPSTARLKTEKTIIEKLRRERSALSRMRDVAGLRIVIRGTRLEQTETVQGIQRLFRWVEPVDRIEQPRQGYRALHLIVTLRGFPVEIQVRTQAQHAWADAYEKLGDRIGRGIRYGALPTDPRLRSVVEAMLRAADQIDLIERNHAHAVIRTTDLIAMRGELKGLPLQIQRTDAGQDLGRQIDELERQQDAEVRQHGLLVDDLVQTMSNLAESLS